MEGAPQPAAGTSGKTDDNWIALLLGVVGIYLLFRNKKSKKESKSETSDNIDTFNKFKDTPMGKSLQKDITNLGIELSDTQIAELDKCLKGFKDEEYKVIQKAAQFVKKEDLYKALSKEEMQIFLPVRKKILDCVDDVLNK